MILLRGARVIDPASGTDRTLDVLVDGGLVAKVGEKLPAGKAEVVDCSGTVLAPGFVDLHVHFREPGREEDETVQTGSAAAAAGGYTAVCPMPNTDPPADNAAVVELVAARGRQVGLVDVYPIGAITVGRAGERLAPMAEMTASAARVRMFSDDGDPVPTAELMRRALEYARAFDAVIVDHAEDPSLRYGGHLHEGEVSALLGLRGIPAEAEEICVARDLALARLTGGRLHVAHVSTAQAVDLVRRAKRDGVRVTCEATPHHLALTDEALRGFDAAFKVAPPLRSREHVDALKAGLADGTIDAVATDHAPHASHRKEQEFEYAPCGMLGLETALGVVLTELVEPGLLSLAQAVDRMSTGPARILGADAHGGPMAPGRPANLVVFDPEATWTVEPERLSSRSRNTPFAGRKLRGRVVHTMLAGRFTAREGQVVR